MTSPDNDQSITPVDQLFTYHIFGVPDECDRYRQDPDSYALAVTGLVDQPTSLPLDLIKNGFEPVTGDMVLQCTTNVHWGRIRFTGTRLLDILDHVRTAEAASKVAFRGADGFTTNLTIQEINEQPDAFLLAYAMNDQPLTIDHGFPVRMTADGRYGYKWPKWLVNIELVDYDYKGHYEGRRGWPDAGIRGEPVM